MQEVFLYLTAAVYIKHCAGETDPQPVLTDCAVIQTCLQHVYPHFLSGESVLQQPAWDQALLQQQPPC